MKIEPIGFNRERASELINSKGLDGVLLGAPENVYYATGCPTLPGTGNPILFALRNVVPSFAFIDKEGRTTLFTWFGVTFGVDFSSEVIPYADAQAAVEELKSFLKDKKRVGIDYGVPIYAVNAIKEIGGEVEIADKIMIQLRVIKSQKEIELLQKSARIAQDVLTNVYSVLRKGISRKDLMQQVRSLMAQFGASGVDHLTIAFGPSNPEIALEELLEENQIVTVDIGAVYEGYVSDIRRLFYTGETVPEEDRKLFETIKSIIDELQDSINPGLSFSQVYDLATKLYEKNGLEPLFASAGHSIGLVTEEAHFSPGNELKVSENMVVNIELYAPNSEGIMIGDEETYLVTEKGLKKITDLERKMFTVKI